MKRILRIICLSAFVLTLFVFTTHPAKASCVLVDQTPGDFTIANFNATEGHHYTVIDNGDEFGFTEFFTGTDSIFIESGHHVVLIDDSSDCAGAGSYPMWFTGGDNRMNPMPSDRIAVYCNKNANPPTLDVWGILYNGKGFELFTFKLADLVKAGPTGIVKNLGKNGIVVAALYPPNMFGISWINGPINATGQADFRKTIKCNFTLPAIQ